MKWNTLEWFLHDFAIQIFFIDQAFSKARKNFYNPPKVKKSFNNFNFISFPYHHGLEKEKDFLNDNGENKRLLALSYNNAIKSKLVKNHESAKRNDVGVMIPCKDCNKCYYGENGRGLEVRLEEHKRSCRLGSQYISVAKHTLELGHVIDWKSSKIVYKENNVGKRRVIEGALISLLKTFENNKSFTQEDIFLNYLICKSLGIKIESFCTPPISRAFSAASDIPRDAVARPSREHNNASDRDEATSGQPNVIPLRRSARLLARQAYNDGIT